MAEKPIQTALLAYGMSGEVFHGPLLQAHPGFQINRVLQRRPSARPAHGYTIVSDAGEIFRDPQVELVIVNTPNDSHYEYARAALVSGKHVIVEKPFTVTVAEADELIDLAQQRNCVLTVFQNRRWDGDFLTVSELVNEKAVGTLVEFEAHYDRFRNTIDPRSWKDEDRPGTGLLYNLGSHMIDQALVLFGAPDFVDARMGIRRPQSKVQDFYDIRLEYPGHFVTLKSSYLVKEQGPRYILHGTGGSFVKYGIDPQEEALKAGKVPGTPGWGSEDRPQWGVLNGLTDSKHVETRAGNYLAFYDNVFDAVRRGKQLAVKPEQSREVIRVIQACYESHSSRCAVPLA